MLPISGLLSDKFGRRTMVLISFTISGTIGFLKSFSPNYLTFAVTEFVVTVLSSSLFMTMFILAIEFVGPKKRVLVGVMVHMLYSIGQIFLGVAAINIHNFRTLLRVLFCPTFLTLTYFWWMPESVRWLINKGQISKAKEILCKAADINKKKLSERTLAVLSKNEELAMAGEELTKSTQNSLPIGEALKSKIILIRLAICFFCWFTINFIYFGINVHCVSLGGSKYLNFTLVNFSEIPATILTYFLMGKMGRRTLYCGSMILVSAACVIDQLVPDDEIHWRLIMLILVKFGVSIAFTILYLYTSELFPTCLRQSCMNSCNTFGRVGAVLAPQIPLLVSFFFIYFQLQYFTFLLLF